MPRNISNPHTEVNILCSLLCVEYFNVFLPRCALRGLAPGWASVWSIKSSGSSPLSAETAYHVGSPAHPFHPRWRTALDRFSPNKKRHTCSRTCSCETEYGIRKLSNHYF